MSDETLSKLLASMSSLSPINRIQYQVMMFSDMDESIGSQIGNEIEKIRHSFDRTGSYQIWDGESSFELLEQIFQIAELLRQSSRYVLLGTIYKKIIFLLMHFISNSIHLDDDVENFMDRITDDLMKWEWSEMTEDELGKLSAAFADADLFSLLDDFNYGDRIRMALQIL